MRHRLRRIPLVAVALTVAGIVVLYVLVDLMGLDANAIAAGASAVAAVAASFSARESSQAAKESVRALSYATKPVIEVEMHYPQGGGPPEGGPIEIIVGNLSMHGLRNVTLTFIDRYGNQVRRELGPLPGKRTPSAPPIRYAPEIMGESRPKGSGTDRLIVQYGGMEGVTRWEQRYERSEDYRETPATPTSYAIVSWSSQQVMVSEREI